MISLAEKAPFLTVEWSVKNQPLTPDDVSYGSNKIVWWHGICGHEWQASIKSRSTGRLSGCPYCTGHRVLKGYNDLATRFPEIAAEWSDRNGSLLPDQVTAFANRKVWWKGACGHEWQALISDRSSGHGCPYCKDHKLLIGFNDFQTLHPDIAIEWSEQNDVPPNAISEKKLMIAWWKCSSCGGEYRAWISSRLAGSKCPYCSNRKVESGVNDLATTDPEIADEWLYEKNGAETPLTVSRTSCKDYWWKSSCGHEWKAKVSDRTIHRVPCAKCEAAFQSMLTRLLIMLNASRKQERILFRSDAPIGFPVEMYIPGLSAVIEEASQHSYQQKEQAIKARMCSRCGITYLTYHKTDTIREATEEAKRLLKRMNIFIQSDIENDISIVRQRWEMMRDKQNK